MTWEKQIKMMTVQALIHWSIAFLLIVETKFGSANQIITRVKTGTASVYVVQIFIWIIESKNDFKERTQEQKLSHMFISKFRFISKHIKKQTFG